MEQITARLGLKTMESFLGLSFSQEMIPHLLLVPQLKITIKTVKFQGFPAFLTISTLDYSH